VEPSVIEHIRSNVALRHLIAGWAKIVPTAKDVEAIEKGDKRLMAITTRERWATISAVSGMDVDAWADFLFAHNIITDKGVDPVALTIVSRIGIAGLPKDLRDGLLKRGGE
jgi:hypothetical protein